MMPSIPKTSLIRAMAPRFSGFESLGQITRVSRGAAAREPISAESRPRMSFRRRQYAAMERKADDGVDQIVRHDVCRNVARYLRSEPRLVAIGDQHRNRWETAGEQPLDQFFSFDDELSQPAGIVGRLERSVDGDPGVVQVGNRHARHGHDLRPGSSSSNRVRIRGRQRVGSLAKSLYTPHGYLGENLGRVEQSALAKQTTMNQKPLLAGFILLLGSSLSAQSLDLPPRQPSAPQGTAFALSIAALPLAAREEKALAEVMAGNVPSFLRKLVPVSVAAGSVEATYFVTPDYLAIGSDDDFFLTPLTPLTAQAIADRLDCVLPTPKMVDDALRTSNATVTTLNSLHPLPPSTGDDKRWWPFSSVKICLRSCGLRAGTEACPGPLVAGHKKDVVIANKVFATPGKVAIYGWHKPDGKPIQPLYTGHTASWVDYSHGIRLVSRRMMVDGVATTIDAVLADPERAPLLSNEGVMRQTRYLRTDPTPDLKAARGAKLEVIQLDGGVRVVIDRPPADSAKPVLLRSKRMDSSSACSRGRSSKGLITRISAIAPTRGL